jgi:hypothetical protein
MVSFTSFRVARRPERLRIDPHKPTYQYLLSNWTRLLPWTGRGYKRAERFRVLLLLDLSTPEDSYALCGIWANSESFLLARSRRADRVGPAGDAADCFDRNVWPDSDLI